MGLVKKLEDPVKAKGTRKGVQFYAGFPLLGVALQTI